MPADSTVYATKPRRAVILSAVVLTATFFLWQSFDASPAPDAAAAADALGKARPHNQCERMPRSRSRAASPR